MLIAYMVRTFYHVPTYNAASRWQATTFLTLHLPPLMHQQHLLQYIVPIWFVHIFFYIFHLLLQSFVVSKSETKIETHACNRAGDFNATQTIPVANDRFHENSFHLFGILKDVCTMCVYRTSTQGIIDAYTYYIYIATTRLAKSSQPNE